MKLWKDMSVEEQQAIYDLFPEEVARHITAHVVFNNGRVIHLPGVVFVYAERNAAGQLTTIIHRSSSTVGIGYIRLDDVSIVYHTRELPPSAPPSPH